MNMDPQRAAAQAVDPATSAEQLAGLAVQHRELWPQLAAHPNAYDGLVDWMRQQGFDPGAAAPPQPVAPLSVAPQPAAPQFPQPVPPERSAAPTARRGWMIGGIAAALVIALVAIVAVLVFAPRGGGSLESRLALLEIENEEGFWVTITDHERLRQALGDEYPADASPRELDEWFMDPDMMDRVRMDLASMGEILDGLPYESSASVGLIGPNVWALEGDFSEQRLDDAFGAAADGVWEAEGYMPVYLTLIDGTVYVALREDRLPTEAPDPARSFAGNESAMRVLRYLDEHGNYRMSALGPEYAPGSAEDVLGMGSGLSLVDDHPHLTLVFDHASASAAERNLDELSDYLPEGFELRVEGRFVIGEFELEHTMECARLYLPC